MRGCPAALGCSFGLVSGQVFTLGTAVQLVRVSSFSVPVPGRGEGGPYPAAAATLGRNQGAQRVLWESLGCCCGLGAPCSPCPGGGSVGGAPGPSPGESRPPQCCTPGCCRAGGAGMEQGPGTVTGLGLRGIGAGWGGEKWGLWHGGRGRARQVSGGRAGWFWQRQSELFWQQDAGCLFGPHSGFQGCQNRGQRRGGSSGGRGRPPEVWEPPVLPPPALLSFSTALAVLAVPGRGARGVGHCHRLQLGR